MLYVFFQTIKEVDLQMLSGLEYLDLSRNLIGELMPGAFIGMASLKGLDFSVNAVRKVQLTWVLFSCWGSSVNVVGVVNDVLVVFPVVVVIAAAVVVVVVDNNNDAVVVVVIFLWLLQMLWWC